MRQSPHVDEPPGSVEIVLRMRSVLRVPEGRDPVLRRRQDRHQREEAFARLVEELVVAGERRDGDADRFARAGVKRRRPVPAREVDRSRVPRNLRGGVRERDAVARRHPRLELVRHRKRRGNFLRVRRRDRGENRGGEREGEDPSHEARGLREGAEVRLCGGGLRRRRRSRP